MKRYVADVNVIFSTLISGHENYLRMFTDFEIMVPDFALLEMQEHQTRILRDTRVNPETFRELTLKIFRYLTIVPNLLLSNRSYLAAWQLCKDIDEDDTAYLAVAVEFDDQLISKDAVLVNGLRAKGFQNVLHLSEFFALLEEQQ